jgi:polysaccharide biosynthesis protein PslH
MELLFLTPQLPYPPHQGTSLRNFNIIRGLADRHSITLLSFTEHGVNHKLQDDNPLLEYCRRIVTVPEPAERSTMTRLRQMAASRIPDLARRLRSSLYELRLRKLLSENSFAVVQVEGIELAWTISVIRDVGFDQKIVFDAHNAEAQLQRRAFEADLKTGRRWPAAAYSWLQSGRLRDYERWACGAADWVTAVSRNDAKILRSQMQDKKLRLSVIPNSIDVLAYKKASLDRGSGGDKAIPAYDIIFTGKMDYRPNVDAVFWFAQEVWPEILTHQPSCTWAVVGQKPHERLAAVGKLPGVALTGWVDDVLPYLKHGKVFIMPFRVGSGTRLKLIEAMAVGLPVVSTSLGVEGYPVQHEKELIIAETAVEMSASIRRILADPELQSRLRKSGQEFALRYDWRRIIPQFDEVYHALVE